MSKSCIVCDSMENRVVFREIGIDILKCTNCGHVFSSYNASQDYDGYFDAEHFVPDDQSFWNEAHEQIYDDFCQRFVAGKGGKLLDVGCGLGYFVKRVSAFPSWQVFGCEISKLAVDYARTKLELPNMFCGKVEDSEYPKKSFDIITLWDVIEHIPNPHYLLSYLSSLLTDDGMLFIHTPNVNIHLPKAKIKKALTGMSAYLHPKDHVNIYSSKTITHVLHRNGFSNVKFVHLRPIQRAAGVKNKFLIFLKNLWFYSSVILFYITLRRINIDNLFILAKK